MLDTRQFQFAAKLVFQQVTGSRAGREAMH